MLKNKGGRPPKPVNYGDDMSVRAAATFAHYCALGIERSYHKLAILLKEHEGFEGNLMTIERRVSEWGRRYAWQDKVREYDLAKAEERRRRLEREWEKMNEEHAHFGRTQMERAIDVIGKLIAQGKFGGQAAVQLFKYASDLERMAMEGSLPPESQNNKGEVRIVIEQDIA